MIKVEVVKNSAKCDKIIISGHAMYADYGNDIVCSAVSSIVITTVNGILALDSKSLCYTQDNDVFTIEVKNDSDIYQTLLENMISLLKELECQYPTNVKVK